MYQQSPPPHMIILNKSTDIGQRYLMSGLFVGIVFTHPSVKATARNEDIFAHIFNFAPVIRRCTAAKQGFAS
jgi:hypothetical protein